MVFAESPWGFSFLCYTCFIGSTIEYIYEYNQNPLHNANRSTSEE